MRPEHAPPLPVRTLESVESENDRLRQILLEASARHLDQERAHRTLIQELRLHSDRTVARCELAEKVLLEVRVDCRRILEERDHHEATLQAIGALLGYRTRVATIELVESVRELKEIAEERSQIIGQLFTLYRVA